MGMCVDAFLCRRGPEVLETQPKEQQSHSGKVILVVQLKTGWEVLKQVQRRAIKMFRRLEQLSREERLRRGLTRKRRTSYHGLW